MDSLSSERLLFAERLASKTGIPVDSPLMRAFAAIPREQFVAPPPWPIFTRQDAPPTVSSDPATLYQDTVIPLRSEGPLNNGQPSLHAHSIAALDIHPGETVVHIGAGTGYYTAILARLTGTAGAVFAFETEADLAARARQNLATFPNVRICSRSGTEGPLPLCDVLYVSAGATDPLALWLDALHQGGRLLFPMTDDSGSGAMLLIHKRESSCIARFLSAASFVPCVGARDRATASRLARAFRRNTWTDVRSLHCDNDHGPGCWCYGQDWWLSTEP